jgi:uncharacterized membrane protein AbrB (regulator of aidB expression)
MSTSLGLLTYVGLGIVGGVIGAKLKIPAGALIGAMLTIILFKMTMKVHWEIPKGVTFALQVFVGIMVGATFQPELFHVMKKIALPVILSCVVLVGVGAIKAIVFTRLGMLDLPGNESGGNERPDRNGIRQPGPTHAGGLFSFRAGGVCPPHRLVRI